MPSFFNKVEAARQSGNPASKPAVETYVETAARAAGVDPNALREQITNEKVSPEMALKVAQDQRNNVDKYTQK